MCSEIAPAATNTDHTIDKIDVLGWQHVQLFNYCQCGSGLGMKKDTPQGDKQILKVSYT